MPKNSANDGYRKKRERLIAGCEGCRARHVKCDTKLPSCFQCMEGNIQCVREPNIRFRNLHVRGKESDLSFSETQTWIPLENSIQFHDETPGLIQIYRKDALTSSPEDQFMGLAATFAQDSRFQSSRGLETVEKGRDDDNAMQSIFGASHSNQEHYEIIPPEVNQGESGPGGATESEYTPQYSRQYSAHTFASPATTVSNDMPDVVGSQSTTTLLTDREAVLIRNFIENMALWVGTSVAAEMRTRPQSNRARQADITDLKRHFEIEVPRRALHQPVLRLAICAFSSRHMSRNFEYDETEALQYHNECVQCLIPKLSEPSEEINEDVLAAISILRQYEEMDAFDNRCHLIGTTKLLNSISRFGSSGGLGEAAAWLCLRQDIYVSLVSQQPLKTRLENYHNSKTFQRKDDVSLANQMVFLLAKVLSYAFLPDQNTTTVALQQIDREVDEWYMTKPAAFTPIRFAPRSREHHRAFPEVWLLSPFHALALQYYHIAKLVLTVSIRQPQISGYENLRQGRKIEKCVRNHLLVILGLAASNRAAENILFTARHTLSVWGGVLRDELERECTVSLLQDMEKRTGWRAAQLINSLKEQWDEDVDTD